MGAGGASVTSSGGCFFRQPWPRMFRPTPAFRRQRVPGTSATAATGSIAGMIQRRLRALYPFGQGPIDPRTPVAAPRPKRWPHQPNRSNGGGGSGGPGGAGECPALTYPSGVVIQTWPNAAMNPRIGSSGRRFLADLLPRRHQPAEPRHEQVYPINGQRSPRTSNCKSWSGPKLAQEYGNRF